MGWYENHVLPRVIHVVLGNEAMAKVRRPALVGLHGTVLELGFGSGPNVPLYPAEVERVLAVDPSVVAQRLATRRLAASPVAVDFVGLDGARLPVDDGSVDCVLSTWTLCTIPDVDAAMQEVARVLRPGGAFHYLEHGLSDDPRIARRQHRWNGVQKRIGGGCHIDRRIDHIVAGSGLVSRKQRRFQINGPKAMNAMYEGVVIKD